MRPPSPAETEDERQEYKRESRQVTGKPGGRRERAAILFLDVCICPRFALQQKKSLTQTAMKSLPSAYVIV